MGFITSAAEAEKSIDEEVGIEDEMAELHFKVGFGMVQQRCSRGKWMVEGSPSRLTKD